MKGSVLMLGLCLGLSACTAERGAEAPSGEPRPSEAAGPAGAAGPMGPQGKVNANVNRNDVDAVAADRAAEGQAGSGEVVRAWQPPAFPFEEGC